MFLDDRLLEICADYVVNDAEDLQELNKVLFKECVEYYQKILHSDMTKKEVKTLLDKTFNLWDSFIGSAKKNEHKKLNILADLFEKHSFRVQFLHHPAYSQFYESLI